MKPEYRPVAEDELVFDVKVGLTKARKFLPRTSRPVDPDPFGLAAKVIVGHLELAGVRCYRKPPVRPHSTSDFMGEPSPDGG